MKDGEISHRSIKRTLGIAQLKEFTSNQCDNDFLTMVHILLEDFELAKRCFRKVNPEIRKRIIELPIVRFCDNMKNW